MRSWKREIYVLEKYKGFSRENLQFLIVFKIYSWVGKFKLSAAVLVNWNVVALGTVNWVILGNIGGYYTVFQFAGRDSTRVSIYRNRDLVQFSTRDFQFTVRHDPGFNLPRSLRGISIYQYPDLLNFNLPVAISIYPPTWSSQSSIYRT